MSNNSGEKLTNFRNTISVVTAKFLNSMFGGLYGSSEGDLLDPNDPLVFGHVHDGVHADGHAQKIDLVDHVTNKLTGNNIANATIQQYHLAFTPTASPGGNDREVQFNDAGTFEGTSTFKVNSSLDLELNTGSKFYFGNASLAYNPTTPDPELKFDMPLDGPNPGIINFTFDNVDTYNLTRTQFTPLSGITASLGNILTPWNSLYVGDLSVRNNEIVHSTSSLEIKGLTPGLVGRLDFYSQGQTNFVSLESPAAISGDYRIRLPDAIGSANQVLTISSATAGIISSDWSDVPSQDLFETITDGVTNIVASSPTDTLTLVAGTDISLSLDAIGKSVTINSTGGSGGTPAGVSGNMQFNDSGSFGGVPYFNVVSSDPTYGDFLRIETSTISSQNFGIHFGSSSEFIVNFSPGGTFSNPRDALTIGSTLSGTTADIEISEASVNMNSNKLCFDDYQQRAYIVRSGNNGFNEDYLTFATDAQERIELTNNALLPVTKPIAIGGNTSPEYFNESFITDMNSNTLTLGTLSGPGILDTEPGEDLEVKIGGSLIGTSNELIMPRRVSFSGSFGANRTFHKTISNNVSFGNGVANTFLEFDIGNPLVAGDSCCFKILVNAQLNNTGRASAMAEIFVIVDRLPSLNTRFDDVTVSFIANTTPANQITGISLIKTFTGAATTTQTVSFDLQVLANTGTYTGSAVCLIECLNRNADLSNISLP